MEIVRFMLYLKLNEKLYNGNKHYIVFIPIISASKKNTEIENKFRLQRKIKILQSHFDIYIYWSLVSDFRNRKF
ncbi:hypothetical protein AEQU3_02762 [Aequorivita antarctica]|nr:hypothetical protein AEQU3_02762 [Aequorivita antarctica]